MPKSTTKQPVRPSSGERKNASPDENAWATNPIERIKTSIAFPTALSSSTIATIGPLFGTWQDRYREQLLRRNGYPPRDSFLSNLGATATFFDCTNVVLRLYKCIGTQRLASEGRKFCVPCSKLRHRHRPSYHPRPCWLTISPPA